MTITVLVPDEVGEAEVNAIEGMRALRYHPGRPLPPGAPDAQVLVPDFLAPDEHLAALRQLPALRLVQLLTNGAEPWVGQLPDGVLLSSCRGAHGGSTAEWALAALLAVYRDLFRFDRARVRREWSRQVTDTLQDKRVMVIGAGDLGQAMRRRLLACDAQVTMVGTTARAGVHGVDAVPGLLGAHDAVVLMVPLTESTERMVDAGFLARMPDGAILVNAARGRVVDADALLAELTAGRLLAALDVTDPEPLPPDHPLWTAPGLLLTPHVAGSVQDFRKRAYRVAAAELARFAAGEPPNNLVRGNY